MEDIMKMLPFIGFSIIGSIMHIVGQFAELEKNKRRFSPKTWLNKNLYRTLLGFMLSVGGVLMLSEIQELTFAVCLLMGYTGDSLLKKGQK